MFFKEKLLKKIVKLEKEIHDMKKDHVHLDDENKILHEELFNKRFEVQNLNEDIRNKITEIRKLNDDISNNNEIKAFNDNLGEIINFNNVLMDRISEFNGLDDKLVDRIVDLRNFNNDLEDKATCFECKQAKGIKKFWFGF